MDANHSKKPKRKRDSSPIYNLAQLHKLQTKKFLSFWISNTPPLKVNLFLLFQTVQKMHNGMDFHIFFLFFPTKGPLQLITQGRYPTGLWPLYKNMIYRFFFTTTQKTTIKELSPSFLGLVKSKHLPPRSLPSKEHNFGWNSIHPNATFWKNGVNGVGQQVVRFLDSKLTVSSSLPRNRVFLQRRPVTPQDMELVPYHIQLPIIKIPKKS